MFFIVFFNRIRLRLFFNLDYFTLFLNNCKNPLFILYIYNLQLKELLGTTGISFNIYFVHNLNKFNFKRCILKQTLLDIVN